MAIRETVILVHGTWAAPRGDRLQWYQRGLGADSFVEKLNRALAERGCEAICWAHCGDADESFSWTGANSWIDRTKAANQLADYLTKLHANGWTCHVIAHSHGGNIVADAYEAMWAKGVDVEKIPTAITLGTPFVDVVTPIARDRMRRARVQMWAVWIAFMLGFAFGLQAVLRGLAKGQPIEPLSVIILAGLLGIAGIQLVRSWNRKRRLPLWVTPKSGSKRPLLQAFTSPADEAWQLLHHIRTIANPLKPKQCLVRFLLNARSTAARQLWEIDRIRGATSFRDQSIFRNVVAGLLLLAIPLLYFPTVVNLIRAPRQELLDNFSQLASYEGLLRIWYVSRIQMFLSPTAIDQLALSIKNLFAATLFWFFVVSLLSLIFGRSFYSAMWSPLRTVTRFLKSLGAIPGAFGTYTVRHRGWPLLQDMAYGLEGYRFALPDAKHAPTSGDPNLVKLHLISDEIRDRALVRRSAWFERNFGKLTELFENMALTAADLSLLVRMIETDVTLVHASYYTDDECIALIADCIADKPAASSLRRFESRSEAKVIG